VLWSDFREADVKTTSFILTKQEKEGDYNTEREAGRLLKMQPEAPDKSVNLPSFNTLSSRLAYRRLLTISRLSVVRGPHATRPTKFYSYQVDIHARSENVKDNADKLTDKLANSLTNQSHGTDPFLRS
jgi:hypothetical protein